MHVMIYSSFIGVWTVEHVITGCETDLGPTQEWWSIAGSFFVLFCFVLVLPSETEAFYFLGFSLFSHSSA